MCLEGQRVFKEVQGLLMPKWVKSGFKAKHPTVANLFERLKLSEKRPGPPGRVPSK